MRRLRLAAVVLVALVAPTVLAATPAAAQAPVRVIVHVGDPHGAKVVVGINDSSGQQLWRRVFRGKGRVTLRLTPGHYAATLRINRGKVSSDTFTVKASHPSYDLYFATNAYPPSQSASVRFKVRDGQHRRLTVELRHQGEAVWSRVLLGSFYETIRVHPGAYRLVTHQNHCTRHLSFHLESGTQEVIRLHT